MERPCSPQQNTRGTSVFLSSNETKMKERLRILLCGFVNHANAQNINCSAIARYVDKQKFDVHAFYAKERPLDREAFAGVTLHPVSVRRGIARLSPIRIFTQMMVGAYDLLYMPKMMRTDVTYATCFGQRKCLVSSVEGVISECVNNEPERRRYFARMSAIFAISRGIQESVEKHWRRGCPLLYLGHECPAMEERHRESVRTVVYVGNIKENKRPFLFLECARAFPDLRFIMIGDGDLEHEVREHILRERLSNVTLTGRLPNQRVYESLYTADLLLMTSKNEGLPKVILEAASCGVPAIYLNECYSVDYIEDGITGYAVPDVAGMIDRIRQLQGDPATFGKISRKAQEMAKAYHWSKLIGGYERFFEDAYLTWRGKKGTRKGL